MIYEVYYATDTDLDVCLYMSRTFRHGTVLCRHNVAKIKISEDKISNFEAVMALIAVNSTTKILDKYE